MRARTAGLALLLAMAALGTPCVASAGPFPPVASVSVSPIEPAVGQTVQFSTEGTFDPDDGLDALSFVWDFDDGSTGAGAMPTHTYAGAGAYRARVVVSDGVNRTEAGVTVFVLPAPGPAAAWSSALLLREDLGELWVADGDGGRIVVLDLSTLSVIAEIEVCQEPTAVTGDATIILVGCAGTGEIVTLDPADHVVIDRHRIGVRVEGLVALSGDRVLAALPSENAVVVLAPDFRELFRVAVRGEPHAVARDGTGRVGFSASFLSRGESSVTRIDLESGVSGVIGLAMSPGPDTPSSSRGLPNLLGAMAIDPSGETLWVGGLKSNVGRGLYRDGLPLTPESRTRGVMTPIELGTGTEALAARIDTNDADRVSAIAFSPRGRFAYVTHPGLGAVSTYDLSALRLFSPGPGATFPFRSRLSVGDRPDAIVISGDGTRGYVRAAFSRSIVVLDLTEPGAPTIFDTRVVLADVLDPEIALGRTLFARSTPPLHSRSGYVACASCHPDGGHDAQTWDFTHAGEGLRNTSDLRGRAGTETGLLHWSGNFDEVQDFENDIVGAFGGTGLAQDGLPPNPPMGTPNAGRSAELDALAAYVSSLADAPRSPFTIDGAPTEAGTRGRALFDASGCPECHGGPRFTDSTLMLPLRVHDVGTLTAASGTRLGAPLTGIDTPSLLGVWASAPYFHDGSAPTLEAVLERNLGDRHGRTSSLSAAERADLVAFLRELDRPDVPSSSCAAEVGNADRSSHACGIAAALWLLARGRIGARRRRGAAPAK